MPYGYNNDRLGCSQILTAESFLSPVVMTSISAVKEILMTKTILLLTLHYSVTILRKVQARSLCLGNGAILEKSSKRRAKTLQYPVLHERYYVNSMYYY